MIGVSLPTGEGIGVFSLNKIPSEETLRDPRSAADMLAFPVRVLSVFAIKMFVFDINNDNLYLSPSQSKQGPGITRSKGNNRVRTSRL